MNRHGENIMDRHPYKHGSYRFDHDSEQEYVEQRGQQRVDRLGVDHVLYHQLAVDRGVAAEKQCEEAREGHHAKSSYLDEHGEYGKTERSECRRYVDGGQSGYAHGACWHKQRVNVIDVSVGAFGHHQEKWSRENAEKEAAWQNERRIGALPHYVHYPVADSHYRVCTQCYQQKFVAVHDFGKPRAPWIFRKRVEYREKRGDYCHVNYALYGASLSQCLPQIENQVEEHIDDKYTLYQVEVMIHIFHAYAVMLISGVDYEHDQAQDWRDKHNAR